jgi:hypothetical protein
LHHPTETRGYNLARQSNDVANLIRVAAVSWRGVRPPQDILGQGVGRLADRFLRPTWREAHRDLRISPAEFDEVAAELGRTLDFVKVLEREKGEVLAAFAAHKDEVTAGYAP